MGSWDHVTYLPHSLNINSLDFEISILIPSECQVKYKGSQQNWFAFAPLADVQKHEQPPPCKLSHISISRTSKQAEEISAHNQCL